MRKKLVRQMDDSLCELIDEYLKIGLSSSDIVEVLARHLYGDIEGRKAELKEVK